MLMKLEILMAFCVTLVGLAFFEPMPAMGSLPVPVESVTGCVRNGKFLIQAPERFRHEQPLQINPCSNIPFDFTGSEGKLIQATGGIDLYNGTFVCPRDVTVIGNCPSEEEASLKDTNARPRMLTKEEAEKIVWDLPEVKALAARMKGTKTHLFTMMITGTPDKEAKPGESAAAYEVYVGEDQSTHTVRVMTVLVDAYDGKVSFYDVVTDRVIPIEDYRKQVEK
ncbi:hypothetical protein SAMN04489760_13824 [Syntrophus gentianae]|uniref:Uncharacterized protein n=1 Tax=Syntrophus gentianae TaxID=43775 RepID=A0A1H8AQ19_9BACT|nr:hypothetical protein [Syntrophus gentianae]SEM71889.1 hypothetical protein SAMN04489760_13824 [Syntrophus gentianae]